MRIVVAGGTGFLGSHLVSRLRNDRHQVSVLTRRPPGEGQVRWDPMGPADGWPRILEGADAVINLAGESIAPRRWTPARKAAIRDSRIRSTRALVEGLRRSQGPPAILINASAVGIYGPHGLEPITEDTPPGSDFLATLGRAWETEALSAASIARVVLLRTGLVLDKGGGALSQMALPFYFLAGGPLGSGRQYMPWIHRDDWTAMVVWALATPAVTGALNVTAPNPVTNREFARTLGRVLGRPSFMPAPALVLRLVLGELAEALLTGQRALPAKALSVGFRFRHPELEPALRAIYGG